jgi:hypothetical protein
LTQSMPHGMILAQIGTIDASFIKEPLRGVVQIDPSPALGVTGGFVALGVTGGFVALGVTGGFVALGVGGMALQSGRREIWLRSG